MLYRTIYTITCLLLCCLCSGQQATGFPDLKFTHLGKENGLSTSHVNWVHRDRRGIMWFGTHKGLNRYDGSSVKIFLHDEKDSASICDNTVFSIAEDREGWLWLCTSNGLCRFNPLNGRSKNYYHRPGNRYSLADNYENVPFIDSRGRLWLATHAGVQLFDFKTEQFVSFATPPNPRPEWQKNYNIFKTIAEDAQHHIWALSFLGLYLVDEQQRQLQPYYSSEIGANLCFIQTGAGENWVGQWGTGVKKFSPGQNSYVQHPQIKSSIVNAMVSWTDNEGREWIVMAQDEGLSLADPKTGNNRQYHHSEQDPQSPANLFISAIYKDPDNRLWLPGPLGIDIIDPYLQNFTNHRLYDSIPGLSPKSYGTVRAMLETGEHYIVSTWFQKPVRWYDKSWKLVRSLNTVPPNASSINSHGINTIQQDSKGNTWYGTDSGLVKEAGGRFTVYLPPGNTSAGLGNLAIRNIIERPDGKFWVRAYHRGILLFDPTKEQFTRFYQAGENGLEGDMTAMCMDRSQQLWVGSDNGVYYLDERTGRFINIPLKNNTGNHLQSLVYDILCAHDGVIWVASANSIAKIDPFTKAYTEFTAAQGLPSSAFFHIIEDSTGCFWLSCNEGIIKFDKKNSFRLFSQASGLPYETTETAGLFSFTGKGHILYGTNGIVTEFNPYAIKENTTIPELVFVSCTVNGSDKEITSDGAKRKVYLQPGESNANIHFSLLNYTSPEQNKYYYLVEGVSNDWQEAVNGNIYLTRLAPGTYTLKAKGSNNNGVFNREEEVLYIIVKPHWYQTIWFKAGCVLLLIAAALAFYFWRIRTVKRSAGLKQKMAETEMMALKAQMSPHFIFNSLNSIENFIMLNEKRLASDYLNKFSRLIRVMLDNSRNEWIPVGKDLENLQLYIDLELLRFQQKFTYSVDADAAILQGDYRVPSMLVQPYLENAILHGIAHSERKDLELELKVTVNGDYIQYTIRDNGIGRQQAEIYNQRNRPKHQSMGMSITAERVRHYNGTGGGVVINDLPDATGTEVVVNIKYQ